MSHTNKFSSIPMPDNTVEGNRQTLLALKEAVEILTRQARGDIRSSAVTWNDLIDTGVVAADQVPRT